MIVDDFDYIIVVETLDILCRINLMKNFLKDFIFFCETFLNNLRRSRTSIGLCFRCEIGVCVFKDGLILNAVRVPVSELGIGMEWI